jgi:hypothetical protein
MAKRGRAPKGEYAGKTEVMSFRITPSTKAALKRAAAAEIDHCLRKRSIGFVGVLMTTQRFRASGETQRPLQSCGLLHK